LNGTIRPDIVIEKERPETLLLILNGKHIMALNSTDDLRLNVPYDY
jgi:hypothetical protein